MSKQLVIICRTFTHIIWAQRKKITVVALVDFLTTTVADFVNPKFPLVKIIFIVLIPVLAYCICRLAHWLKKHNFQSVPSTKQINHPQQGLGISLFKGIPYVTLGLVSSGFFLVFQLFSSDPDKGALASGFPKLALIQKILLDIDQNLVDINNKLDNVKKETSQDARKELQNKGIPWTSDNFLTAVKEGDEETVALFLQGGMHPETATSQGRTLPVMLALNTLNPEAMLKLLLGNGLDIDAVYTQPAGMSDLQSTLLSAAIERGNQKVVAALIKSKANLNKAFTTPAAFGFGINKFPLAAAIYWKQPEIVFMLLDANADISSGEYEAYQEAIASRNNYFWKNHVEAINKIIERTAPSGNKKRQIDASLRIDEIDQEITKLALKSIESAMYPNEQQVCENQIKHLETEKKELLKVSGGK